LCEKGGPNSQGPPKRGFWKCVELARVKSDQDGYKKNNPESKKNGGGIVVEWNKENARTGSIAQQTNARF